MKAQVPAESRAQDPEAILLARIYRLILAWPDLSENSTADPEDLGREPGLAAETPAREEQSAS